MMSALSARTSITLAVMLSAVAFGLFHIDRFLLDARFATIFILSPIALGAFLGVWAVQTSSIAGPAGFHGAFNALSFVASYLDGATNAGYRLHRRHGDGGGRLLAHRHCGFVRRLCAAIQSVNIARYGSTIVRSDGSPILQHHHFVAQR